MKKILVQIYETRDAEEAKKMSELGIDHIGILVGDGAFPREKTISEAKEIAAAILPPSLASAIYLGNKPDFIEKICSELRPPILHLAAAAELLSPDDLEKIKRRFPNILLMRSIPVSGENTLPLAKSYEGKADFLLLDTHVEGDPQIGAVGKTHDWNIDRKIVETVKTPVIIAGGLGPKNVADAIRAVRPAGVDSKTKTDLFGGKDGKDMALVAEFAAEAEKAAKALDEN